MGSGGFVRSRRGRGARRVVLEPGKRRLLRWGVYRGDSRLVTRGETGGGPYGWDPGVGEGGEGGEAIELRRRGRGGVEITVTEEGGGIDGAGDTDADVPEDATVIDDTVDEEFVDEMGSRRRDLLVGSRCWRRRGNWWLVTSGGGGGMVASGDRGVAGFHRGLPEKRGGVRRE